MEDQEYIARNARENEFSDIGKLMVQIYSQMEAFHSQTEQPDYYKMLANPVFGFRMKL
jgi:hypothetical protein